MCIETQILAYILPVIFITNTIVTSKPLYVFIQTKEIQSFSFYILIINHNILEDDAANNVRTCSSQKLTSDDIKLFLSRLLAETSESF